MTPEEIRERQFRRSIRGYNMEDVRAFLHAVAESYTTLLAQQQTILAHATALEAEQRASRELEHRLRGMLAAMESASAAMVDQSRSTAAAFATQAEHERLRLAGQARNEAALILRDAERKAQRIIDEADARRNAAREEISLLHTRRAVLVARIKALLASQVEFLRAIERDMRDPGEDAAPAPRDAQPHDDTHNEGLGAAELHSIIAQLEGRKQD